MKLRFKSTIAAVCLILSMFSFVAPASAVTAAPETIKLGDVNGDGKVNSGDYTLIRRFILQTISEFPDPNGKIAGDVDRNGVINAGDYTLVRKYILRIIKDFNVTDIYKDPNAPIADRVNDLMSKMTIEEKIGQMIQPEWKNATPDDVKNYYLGSVLSGGGSSPIDNTVESWRKMISDYQQSSMSTRLGIPLLYGTDAVHGHNNLYGAAIFPHNIGLGAAANPELMKGIAKVTAEDLISTGVNWNFGPCIAVTRDERWGRTYESYSENYELINKLSIPFIDVLQKDYGITATAKHFLADGGTTGGIDQGNAVISEDELRRIHLPVYKEAVDKGVKSVMVSFSSWNGVKNHENKYLITDILKGELGFKGLVVSDWEAIHQLSGATFYDQVAASVNAGIDMLMEPIKWKESYEAIEEAVEKGDITEERINDAVGRILKVKFEMGVFEKPLGNQDLVSAQPGSQEHRDIAKQAVRESLVLLKNENSVLPLKKNAKIYLPGRAANDVGAQCGGWTLTWKGNTDSFGRKAVPGTTILEAFTKVAEENGGTIVTDLYEAADADVAVLVLAEYPYAEVFGDNTDLSLNGENMLYGNEQALEDAKASGLPIVTVLISGRPRIITNELKDWDAFVSAWLPGTEADGIAEVLFGDYDFKGKLPLAWPASNEQIPVNEDNAAEKTPLFPYGYGLTMFK